MRWPQSRGVALEMEDAVLARGDLFPHISVHRLDGTSFAYGDVWQRRNLLFVALPGRGVEHARAVEVYAATLAAHDTAFQEYETAVVVTREPVAGLPSPAVVVADRWGEIAAVETARDVASLPPAGELLEWLRFVVQACPECEGEVR